MEQKDTIKDLLYEKMSNEQKDFVENLKHLPPEKIIQSAYEKVMRDDILMLFEDDFLDDKQIKALLRLEKPLSACYDEWLKNECSYMDMLRDKGRRSCLLIFFGRKSDNKFLVFVRPI